MSRMLIHTHRVRHGTICEHGPSVFLVFPNIADLPQNVSPCWQNKMAESPKSMGQSTTHAPRFANPATNWVIHHTSKIPRKWEWWSPPNWTRLHIYIYNNAPWLVVFMITQPIRSKQALSIDIFPNRNTVTVTLYKRKTTPYVQPLKLSMYVMLSSKISRNSRVTSDF